MLGDDGHHDLEGLDLLWDGLGLFEIGLCL
jgi:hypothetical protein